MQSAPKSDMDDRLMFYGCSLVRNQVERGDEIYVFEVPRAEGLTEGMSKGAEQMRESIKARLEKLGLSQELIDEALKS